VSDLGGSENLSAQQHALVEMATRSRLYLDHIDAWLLTQPTLIVGRGRNRGLLPVLKERQQIADSLARVLGQLGLERRARAVGIKAAVAKVVQAGGPVGVEPKGLAETAESQ
jgi:hypothetical protein